MQKKKNSIKAIAKELNISATTISFVLNGKAQENRISQSLIDRVQAHIKQIGYEPSQLAKSLRTGKSNILVFMVEDISNPFFATIAKSIEDRAFLDGYKTIYCSTNNDPVKTQSLIRMFRDLQVDGYIITPPDGLEDRVIRELLMERKSVILFDRFLPDLECSYVGIDNFQATTLGLNSFLEKGYKQIGFITLESDQSQMHDRMLAYDQTCRQNRLESHVLKIPFRSYSSLESEILMEDFFLENKKLQAVFFATNYLATMGIRIFSRLGIAVPGQLAVIAFDDNEFFKFNKPSVSSIVQPQEDLADILTQVMFKLLDPEKSEKEFYTIILPATLKERESTGVSIENGFKLIHKKKGIPDQP